MENIDHEGYRANVGVVLINNACDVFWAGRAGRKGWQFPQGGVQHGEAPQDAMYRELAEEIGLKKADVEILGFTEEWLRYRLPRRYQRRDQHPLCIGQKQRWFLLKLVDGDTRFRFDATEAPEFDRWRWVDYWRPVKDVIYFKRKVYADVLNEFGPKVFPHGAPPTPRWWPKNLDVS